MKIQSERYEERVTVPLSKELKRKLDIAASNLGYNSKSKRKFNRNDLLRAATLIAIKAMKECPNSDWNCETENEITYKINESILRAGMVVRLTRPHRANRHLRALMQRYEALEDKIDIKDARAALREAKAKGTKSLSKLKR